jgi:hypothetical protein
MLGNVDDLELLRHEFNAGDGSFLIQLRVDLPGTGEHSAGWSRQCAASVRSKNRAGSLTAGWSMATGTCRTSSRAISATQISPATSQLSTTRQR